MDGGGFEPPKSSTTDLQSAPFGRSGTHPKYNDLEKNSTRELRMLINTAVLTTRMGFEPTTSAVTGRRSNQLSHQANVP